MTDPRLAAADICDRAHDVLMVTGVQCYETRRRGELVAPEGDDTPNCLWQAVAIAAGFTAADWSEVFEAAHNLPEGPHVHRYEARSTPTSAPLKVVHRLRRLPGFAWNDSAATADDVFDVLRRTAKELREEASWTS